MNKFKVLADHTELNDEDCLIELHIILNICEKKVNTMFDKRSARKIDIDINNHNGKSINKIMIEPSYLLSEQLKKNLNG